MFVITCVQTPLLHAHVSLARAYSKMPRQCFSPPIIFASGCVLKSSTRHCRASVAGILWLWFSTRRRSCRIAWFWVRWYVLSSKCTEQQVLHTIHPWYFAWACVKDDSVLWSTCISIWLSWRWVLVVVAVTPEIELAHDGALLCKPPMWHRLLFLSRKPVAIQEKPCYRSHCSFVWISCVVMSEGPDGACDWYMLWRSWKIVDTRLEPANKWNAVCLRV